MRKLLAFILVMLMFSCATVEKHYRYIDGFPIIDRPEKYIVNSTYEMDSFKISFSPYPLTKDSGLLSITLGQLSEQLEDRIKQCLPNDIPTCPANHDLPLFSVVYSGRILPSIQPITSSDTIDIDIPKQSPETLRNIKRTILATVSECAKDYGITLEYRIKHRHWTLCFVQ